MPFFLRAQIESSMRLTTVTSLQFRGESAMGCPHPMHVHRVADHVDEGGWFEGAQRVAARKAQFRGKESVFRQLFVVAENAGFAKQTGYVFHVDSQPIKVHTIAVEIGERLASLMTRGIEVSEEEHDRKSVRSLLQAREAVFHFPGGEDILEPARVVDGYSRELP